MLDDLQVICEDNINDLKVRNMQHSYLLILFIIGQP